MIGGNGMKITFGDSDDDKPRRRSGLGPVASSLALLASIGAHGLFLSGFFVKGANPFDLDMMGLFALGMIAGLAALTHEGDNPLIEFYRGLMKLLGWIFLICAVPMLPVWILGFSIVLSKDGAFNALFVSSFLWWPVYFALPAFLSGAGQR